MSSKYEYEGSVDIKQPKTGEGVHAGVRHECVVKGVRLPEGAKRSDKSAYQFKDKEYTGHPDKPWAVRVKK